MNQLKAHLDRPSKPSHELGYHALQGFLFAMIAGPFSTETKDWTMLLAPEMDDAVHDEFCDLYDVIEKGVIEGAPALPADCPLAPDPLRNLDSDAPVGQWSRGFFDAQKLFAHEWADFLRDCANVDKTTIKAFGHALVHLNFFASREIADLTVRESKEQRTLAEIAAEACASFEIDMATFAMFVRPWRERAARVGPERRPVKSPGTSGLKAHLKAFLVHPSNPPGVFSYHALQGFMFAVTSAPKVIEPHEWLPLVLGERPPVFDPGESQPVMDEMRDLYQEIDARAARGVVALPPDCPMAPEPMANLDPDSPLSQWSRGMFAAHNWLAADWSRIMIDLMRADREMAMQVAKATLHLLFFASPAIADTLYKQWGKGTLKELAVEAHREFQVGMVAYSSIGRGFRARPRRDSYPEPRFASSGAPRAATAHKAGRNEPCPCGSGKKYKKCHGAVH